MLSRRGFLIAAGVAAPTLARAGIAKSGVTFPFATTRNQPWSAVQLDGKTPALPFLIDTGSSDFGVLESTAQDLGLIRLGKGRIQSAVGRADLSFYESDLLLGGVVRADDTPMIGLPALSNHMKGLIPLPRFRFMGLDFDKHQVLLVGEMPKVPDGYQKLEGGAGRGFDDPIDRMGEYVRAPVREIGWDHRPVIVAELDGQPVKLLVDSGFSGGLFLFPDFVRKAGLWDHYLVHLDDQTLTPVGISVSRDVRAERLKMGSVVFQRPIVSLGDPASSDRDGSRTEHGIVGMEFLRRLNLIAHGQRRALWIQPNSAIADGYRYDRAGAEVEIVDGAARVSSLTDGAPAFVAGLRKGDKVLGWRGRDGIEGLSWALKGAPGSKVEILVEREQVRTLIAVTLQERI